MYRVVRKIFNYLIGIFVLQIAFFGFSFAQSTGNNLECGDNPDICNRSALQFQYYEEFVKEMLAGIKTIQADGKNLGSYDYLGGLFTNKIFNIPDENRNILEKLVAEIEESINKKISSATTTVFFLSSLGISFYKDLIGLSILFKSKAFIRDWKTLLDLETQINDVFYELGLSAMADSKIIDSYKFQLILDKYVDSNKLFSKALIYENATYGDIVKMLLKMNGSMKTFLSLDSIYHFDDYGNGNIDGFEIVFDMVEMQKLDKEYECARGFAKCSSSGKDFIENLQNVGKNLKKSGYSAKSVIVDANKNFSQALNGMFYSYKKDKSKGEKQLTDREIELLQDVYGINTSKLTKQQGIGLSDLLNVAKGNVGGIAESIKFNSNFNDDYFNENNKEQKALIKKSESSLKDDYLDSNTGTNNTNTGTNSSNAGYLVFKCGDQTYSDTKNLYEYCVKKVGPKKSIVVYKSGSRIRDGELSLSASVSILKEEAILGCQNQGFIDLNESNLIEISIGNSSNQNVQASKEQEITVEQISNDIFSGKIEELNSMGLENLKYPVVPRKEFKDYLGSTIDNINAKHKDELSVLIAIDTSIYLHLYTQIGYRIRDLIDVVGSKDKDLIKNIGTVCELQCSNKGNAGCYAR